MGAASRMLIMMRLVRGVFLAAFHMPAQSRLARTCRTVRRRQDTGEAPRHLGAFALQVCYLKQAFGC
jgi:hypothetical protein